VCRLELQKLVSHAIADTKLREVASLAQKLLHLQPHNTNSTVSLERHHDVEDGIEFGDDLVFKAPTRFLVDVSLDDGDIMDFKNTVSLAFQKEESSHTDPTDHFVVEVEKFNLTWLRDACDKIVRNCNSQLSRDELAMAICRVLSSEKPGEEVLLDVNILYKHI
jgi:activating signal cointegrator complex subunit 3